MYASTVLQSNISVDNTGISVQLPVIVTSEGILKSYLEYLLLYRSRSQSWIKRSVFAMQLLLDYMDSNNGVFDKPTKMFIEFSNSLFTGTVNENNEDPSGLYWKPRDPDDAFFLINLITQFSDWLSAVNEDNNLQLNPFRKASSFEQRLNWAAYCQKKSRAFMSHLWSNSSAKINNAMVKSAPIKSGKTYSRVGIFDAAKAFPKSKIDSLLYQGFVLPGKEHKTALHERLNLRDVLITILMHFGGLRISEVFHIFVEDIAIIYSEDINYIIKVYHPINGSAPTTKKETRREYLLNNYFLKPRTEYNSSKKIYSGWKNPHLTNSKEKFFIVYFFPQISEKYFFNLWRLYLKHQRVTPEKGKDHPYAFTSRTGQPHTIDSYSASLKRAVERIGLIYGKEYGTTPHGYRHRFGQNLAESGVSPLTIKTALHHRRLESQQPYTQPTEIEIREQLQKAENNITIKNFEKSLIIYEEKNI